jgi:hypothetical protein
VTGSAETTLAVGGERRVPLPDPIARDYLLLCLRLDQLAPGLVDGYYGPADLKAAVDQEQLRPPATLADDAAALRARLDAEVDEPDRRGWLTVQLTALETQARVLAGADVPYVELIRRCFDFEPVRRDEAVFEEAARAIDGLLPGPEPLADRLAAWDAGLVVPPERALVVLDWLVEVVRERAAASVGLPDDERIRVRLTRNQPWTGYNWYEGGRRSRFDVNTDLPIRAPDLIHLAAHEAYPGHHLEHAWKEVELVERRGRLEASVLMINAPECLLSEGLADLGHEIVSPPASEPELLVELFRRAELPLAADPVASRDIAARAVALAPLRRRLQESRVNASLMRHADGRPHDEVLRWLIDVGRFAPEVAAKRLEFIEHPLWRAYVFVYHEGEALLRTWLHEVPPADRPARFGRLLREQLWPSAIAAELAASPGGGSRSAPGGGSGPGLGPTAS